MKILHTADWHLGVALNTEKRYSEFEKTLDFLLELIRKEKIGCILIAGDVFDSPMPPNRAVELYYSFLSRCAAAGVQHVIVIAGNHDSPSFIEAPKALLKHIHVSVFGHLSKNLEEHLVPVGDDAVIAAVPFLHERDIREVMIYGEDYDQQQRILCDGTIALYQKIGALAAERYPDRKLIAMGHFWATPGDTPDLSETVGTIKMVPVGKFPDNIAYCALGHLHWPFAVEQHPRFHYSGSLLKMEMKEFNHEKQVLIFDSASPDDVSAITLPVYQKLMQIEAPMEEILPQIRHLAESGEPVWIKVINTGPFQADLGNVLRRSIEDSPLKLISCENRMPNPEIAKRIVSTEKLTDLTPETVFTRMLEGNKEYSDEQKADILQAFRLAVQETEAAMREENRE